MSNVLTLLRREMGQLFRSPLAYLFLVIYVFVVQLLPMLTMFLARTADLRGFFDLLPWGTVFFAAIITMRSWAEERQENTYEMLLTFPMRDGELVIAKFLSTYLFLSVGILCTATLPIMLFALGDPDPGPILTGYIGALLIAATWCSAGVFFSSLTRSQLAAAIVTLVIGFLSLLLGVQQVASVVDGTLPGLGSLANSLFGTWGHYSALGRGVLELADVLFFVSWTAVFLYLNTLFVGMRRAPRAGTILTAGTLLAIGCGLLGGRLLHGASIARADLTEEGLYTLSPGTVNVLKRAAVPVRATLYVSPRDAMPPEFEQLERDIVDRLEEMRLQSGEMIAVRVVHLEPKNLTVGPVEEEVLAEGEEATAREENDSIERRLYDKGVRPFQVQSFEATEVTNKYIYATLGIAYREKAEELIHPLLPERLSELEYGVASTVARLVRRAPPRIALYLGKEPIDPQLEMMMKRQGQRIPEPFGQVAQLLEQEKFDIVRTKLTQHSPMPEEYDAFVAVGPIDWDDRARWELNRALVSGKPVLLAVQRYTWEYDVDGRGIQAKPETAEPGVDEILEPLGLGVSRRVLMQPANAITLSVQTRNQLQNMLGGARLKLPMHIGLISENFASDSAITDRLDRVGYLWGTALELDRDRLSRQGFEVGVLVHSGDEAWEIDPPTDSLRQEHIAPEGHTFAQFPLVAQISGQFADRYAGQERPKWPVSIEMSPDGRPMPPPPDSPTGPVAEAPGTLILAGSARMWQDGILTGAGGASLLLNCVSAMTLDSDLLSVRSKQARTRQFDEPSPGEALFWRLMALVLVPFGIVAVGCGIAVLRIRGRNRWNREHGR